MKDLPNLRRFFTYDTQYSLTRSRYSDKVIMKSGSIMPSRYLTASVDVQRKTELEEEIKEAQRALCELDGKYSGCEKTQDELQKEDSRVRHEKNQLKVKIDSYKQAQSNISSRQTRLQGIKDASFDLAAEEEKMRQEVGKIHNKRVEALTKLRVHLEESKGRLVECCKAWALVTQAKLKVKQLIHQFRVAKAKLDSTEQAKANLEGEEARIKARVLQLLETARRVSGVQDPKEDQELMSMFNTFPDDLDEVEERIHECQAQADLCMGIDEEAVREYEEREKKIKELDKEISKMQERSNDAESELSDIKESWLGPLKDLLGKVSLKFSDYFRLMSCVGEVALHEDPKDFSHYSVNISVKFRDSEQLQPLNAQRQSGGERSVSTMLYLMALQGITACPFRVVDEINQGMDPVNERRVFDLIVAASSQETESSQYFILTPKLLQELDYTDAVTVHVVHNGQEIPKFRQQTSERFLR
jgi:chromosome segregation ATPase